jgi:hypothetical protein
VWVPVGSKAHKKTTHESFQKSYDAKLSRGRLQCGLTSAGATC